MKEGGVTIIATYVFWNHIEEQEGIFRWDEQRRTLTLGAQEGRLKGDRRFTVRLCGEKESRESLYTGSEIQLEE